MNKLMNSLLLAVIAIIFCSFDGYCATEFNLNKHKTSRNRYLYEMEFIWYNADSTLMVKSSRKERDERIYDDMSIQLNFYSMQINYLRIELNHFNGFSKDELGEYSLDMSLPNSDNYNYKNRIEYNFDVDCYAIDKTYDIQSKNEYIKLVKENLKGKIKDIKDFADCILSKLIKNKQLSKEDYDQMDNLMLDMINYYNTNFIVSRKMW